MELKKNTPADSGEILDRGPTQETLSPEELGERLRAARQDKGWTQQQAGESVGLSRLALLQIEAGTRSISSLELLRLARSYGRQVEDFLGEERADNKPELILGRITAEIAPDWDSKDVQPIFDQLRAAAKLSALLGDGTMATPPFYQFGEPRSYKEAIEQGREMAVLERKRLDLGSAPLSDVAAIISSQSIWAVAVNFPDHVSGLFLRDAEYGLAVLVNTDHLRARRRFSYAHEYAHALADRERKPVPTSRQNASELVEKRANAFASEFLMPEAGVWEALERWQKGAASRECSSLYDVATDDISQNEVRNDSDSQRITTSEVAILAHTFQVSYEVAAYRLSDIGAVRRPQLEELISQTQKDNGRELMTHLTLFNPNEKVNKEEQPLLHRQLALLAIEARRLEKINDGYFEQVCLKHAHYDSEQTKTLLRIAQSMK